LVAEWSTPVKKTPFTSDYQRIEEKLVSVRKDGLPTKSLRGFVSETTAAKKKGETLATMLLPELQEVAARLEIPGAAKLRKSALVTAIEEKQAANRAAKPERAARAPRQKAAEEPKAPVQSSQDEGVEDEAPRNSRGGESNQNNQGAEGSSNVQGGQGNWDEDRRGRRGRNRNRDRDRGRTRPESVEPVMAEDDVLVPVGGIVDILDSYAFIRTAGYLPSHNDVYISLQQVRRYGLRKGDVVTGAVRQAREGERREKFNALMRLDTTNGMDPETMRNRPDFSKLTPLYPQSRLRLETESNILTTRIIDLVSPIGKGQRGLIVSPPKAGKTMVLQAIANAITTNNPECHLMVVLVDERPEEVTDMQLLQLSIVRPKITQLLPNWRLSARSA
jgi:transcription termination factor Rho